MDLRAVDFLDNFTHETRKKIIEFGKTISSTRNSSEVYIAMARKAICFVDLLVQFKLAVLNGIIVSDRVLDMDTSWISGKKVCIIDDVLVSGTSIHKVIEKLEKAGAKEVSVVVLTINSDWYNEEILTTDSGESYLRPPFNKAQNEKCMLMCYDIVKAFSTVPKPYDIDFPLYEDMAIKEQKLRDICNSRWAHFTVTSKSKISRKYASDAKKAFAAVNEYQSLTFYPPTSIIKRIEAVSGLSFAHGYLKMRTYIRKRVRNNTEYHISFLPLAIIDTLTVPELENAVRTLFPSKFDQSLIDKYFVTVESKFRLMQFKVATTLASEFFVDVGFFQTDSLTLSTELPSHSQSRAAYVFLQETLSLLYPISQDIINSTEIDANSYQNIKINEPRGNVLYASSTLSTKFHDLYTTKELKARRLVKENGKKVFNIKRYKDIIRRLEVGFSLSQLASAVSGDIYGTDSNLVTSVYLDIAIDSGIAVPITYFESEAGTVSRSYRHGEDVIFSDVEGRQIAYMLSVFADETEGPYHYKTDGLPELLVEKLITSFIRTGLVEGIFEIYDYANIHQQERDFLRLTYDLHGSVVHKYSTSDNFEPKSYLTPDDTSPWLCAVLKDRNLIKLRQSNKGKELLQDKQWRIFINPSKKQTLLNDFVFSKAESISSTYAYFFRNKYLSTQDLTLINATFGYEQIIPALLAEVSIVNLEFRQNLPHKLRSMFLNEKSRSLIWFKENRKEEFYTAMNSGKWKYDHFVIDFARDKINDIIKQAASAPPDSKDKYRNWSQYWKDALLSTSQTIDQDVSRGLDILCSFLIQSGLLFRTLELHSFYASCRSEDVSKCIDYMREYQRSNRETKTPKKQLDNLVKEMLSENKFNFQAVEAAFTVCEFPINTRSINDDMKIQRVKAGEHIKNAVEAYIGYLKSIDKQQNILQANALINLCQRTLSSRSYSDELVFDLIQHMLEVSEAVEKTVTLLDKYINSYGKIEKPILYRNAVYIGEYNTTHSNLKNLKLTVRHVVEETQSRNPDIDLQLHDGDEAVYVFASGSESTEILLKIASEINYQANPLNEYCIVSYINIPSGIYPYGYTSPSASIDSRRFREWITENISMLSDNPFSVISLSQLDDAILESGECNHLHTAGTIALPSGEFLYTYARTDTANRSHFEYVDSRKRREKSNFKEVPLGSKRNSTTANIVIAQPKITNEQGKSSYEYKKFIYSLLESVKYADLIVFPEYSFDYSWDMNYFSQWTKAHPKCILVAGSSEISDGESHYNAAKIYYNGNHYMSEKRYISPHERNIKSRSGHQSVFTETPVGTVGLLICNDIESEEDYLSELRDVYTPDIICVIACQNDAYKHHNILRNEMSRSLSHNGMYIVYSNLLRTDGVSANGRSAFFAQEYSDVAREMHQAGYISDASAVSQNHHFCAIEMKDEAGYISVVAQLNNKVAINGRTDPDRNPISERQMYIYDSKSNSFNRGIWQNSSATKAET